MFFFLLQFRNLLQTLLNLESNREFCTLEDDADKTYQPKKNTLWNVDQNYFTGVKTKKLDPGIGNVLLNRIQKAQP